MATDHVRKIRKGHLKRAIGVLVALAGVVGFILVMALLAEVVIYTGTGADPATALNLIPAVPPNLEKRLIWLPDAPATVGGRQLEPVVRQKLAGAYLRAWAQMAISYAIEQPYGLATYFGGPAYDQATAAISATVASGWALAQSDLRHAVELTFYAENGNVVAFTDHAVRLVQQYSGKQGEEYVIETDAIYDVVMVLEDGNWRIRAWRRRALPAPVVADVIMPEGVATIAGDTFVVDGEHFRLHGVNYYPSETPWTLFWENYDPKVIDADLAKMQELGLNTVRIFVPFDDFGGDEVNRLRRGRLLDFLNKAGAHNIKVIVTLFDHRTDHAVVNWAADDQHLAQIVPDLAQHRALLAWDIKNEADRDDKANGAALNHAWLRHVAQEIRRLDPNHLLTIGWSTQEAAIALTDVVDFISYHDYGAPKVIRNGLRRSRLQPMASRWF
ncbi:MAG: cellulase family glycosylhydrolase [Anaerolineales bacterium]|nr:cellulase family glycosylhydrolase [Anaerolineales bacterium]